MRVLTVICVVLLLLVTAVSLSAQTQTQAQAQKKRVLFIGESVGFQHDSISQSMGTIFKLGQQTGLWDTFLRTDTQWITKKRPANNGKNLAYFDVVVFYTTGELPMDDSQKADLLSFVREDGKGFLGVHSSTDCFYKWAEYGDMIGGYFDQHPWGTFNAPFLVEDASFPGMSALEKSFSMRDEIYQIKNFSRENVRVLLTLDADKLDLTNKNVHRTDKDFAVIWARNYGKGRVIYNGLGHEIAVWDRPDVQKMVIEHMKWLLGMIPGDATPRPKPAAK